MRGEDLLVLAGLAGLVWAFLRSRARNDDWKDAARRLGLTYSSGLWLEGRRLRGRIGTATVAVEQVEPADDDGSGTATIRITVDVAEIPTDLRLRKRALLPALVGMRDEGELATGDEIFDQAIAVDGDEAVVRAVLDMQCRNRLRGLLVERNGRLEAGKLRCEVKRPSHIVPEVRVMVAIAEALRVPRGTVASRLATTAITDTDAHVRRRCRATLRSRFPSHPETERAMRASLRDTDASARVEAAGALAAAGLPVLETIAGDESVADELRIQAIQLVAKQGTPDCRVRVLERALGARAVPVRVAAIELICRVPYRGTQATLVGLARATEDPRVAEAAALGLGEIGDEAAERPLVALLDSDSTAVAVAAARALGAIGTIAAVEPLLHCTGSVFGSGELTRAARQAVDLIQRRLGPAKQGGLSLADVGSAEGSLSVVSEGGALSIPAEDSAEALPNPQKPPSQ